MASWAFASLSGMAGNLVQNAREGLETVLTEEDQTFSEEETAEDLRAIIQQMQFRHLDAQREYQKLFAEQTKEIDELKQQCGDVAPPAPLVTETTNEQTDLTRLRVSLEEMASELALTKKTLSKAWEDNTASELANSQARRRTQLERAEARRKEEQLSGRVTVLEDMVERVTAENHDLLTRAQSNSEALDGMASDYSTLVAEADAKSSEHLLSLKELNLHNAELKAKVQALEQSLLAAVSATEAGEGEEGGEVLFDPSADELQLVQTKLRQANSQLQLASEQSAAAVKAAVSTAVSHTREVVRAEMEASFAARLRDSEEVSIAQGSLQLELTSCQSEKHQVEVQLQDALATLAATTSELAAFKSKTTAQLAELEQTLQLDRLKLRSAEEARVRLESRCNDLAGEQTAAGATATAESLRLEAALQEVTERSQRELADAWKSKETALMECQQEHERLREVAAARFEEEKALALSELRDQLEAASKAALAATVQQSDDSIASATAARQQAQLEHAQALTAAEAQFIEQKEAAVTASLAAQANEHTKAIAALRAQHDRILADALDTAASAHRQALAELSSRSEASARGAVSSAVDALQAEHLQKSQQQQQEAAAALSASELLAARRLEEALQQAATENAKVLTSANEAALLAQQQAVSEESAKLIAAHDAAMEELNIQHSANLSSALSAARQEAQLTLRATRVELAEKHAVSQEAALQQAATTAEKLRQEALAEASQLAKAALADALRAAGDRSAQQLQEAVSAAITEGERKTNLAVAEATAAGESAVAAAQQAAKEQLEQEREQAAHRLSAVEALRSKAETAAAEAVAQVETVREETAVRTREALQAETAAAIAAAEEAATRLVEQHAATVEEYKQRYMSECRLRKQLHNKLIEIQGNIRVLCRVRPILPHEAKREDGVDITGYPVEGELTIKKDAATMNRFEFDNVFSPTSTQAQVFTGVLPLVTSVLDGYNVCIFAYGQTGSGKTHTMQGPADDRGVNSRALIELFRCRDAKVDELEIEFKVSLLEIYNEGVFDLLTSAREKLDVRLGQAGVYVKGLTYESVSKFEDVERVMATGATNRSVGSHNVNEHSSRSHLVVSVLTKVTNRVTGKQSRGKLHLIDLAGSERVGKTDATGTRLKEAQSINKSLSALGDVVAALASKSKHVPFRNSKLTYLLQDSLGGNSKVLMFVNISPVLWNATESLCSLNFAQRCRSVELGQAKSDSGERRSGSRTPSASSSRSSSRTSASARRSRK